MFMTKVHERTLGPSWGHPPGRTKEAPHPQNRVYVFWPSPGILSANVRASRTRPCSMGSTGTSSGRQHSCMLQAYDSGHSGVAL